MVRGQPGKVVIRKSSSHFSYRYRCYAITTKQLKQLVVVQHMFIVTAYALSQNPLNQQLNLLFAMVLMRFTDLFFVQLPPRIHIRHISRTIDSFTECECWIKFRTKKQDLHRLRRAFRFDYDNIRSDNGCKFTGEEILLIGLRRFSSSDDLEKSFHQDFGREYSQISRAFSIYVRHMLHHHLYLLTNNLAYWKRYFFYFAECVRKKLATKCQLIFPPGTYRVSLFHDCTVMYTTRPGGGPRAGGADALRHHPYVQRAYYNGYKKAHGVKMFTGEAPNGMCAFLYGPMSYRRSDTEMAHASHYNNILRETQIDEPANRQFLSYGDGIFIIESHCIGAHLGPLTIQQALENDRMPKMRISNEWSYGVTANLFPYIKTKLKLKLLLSPLYSKLYVVATIMRNAHLCLYEGLSTSYFGCNCPELEEYFGV